MHGKLGMYKIIYTYMHKNSLVTISYSTYTCILVLSHYIYRYMHNCMAMVIYVQYK